MSLMRVFVLRRYTKFYDAFPVSALVGLVTLTLKLVRIIACGVELQHNTITASELQDGN